MAEAILPGTYITVRDEGLISVGGVASGNIGIVGTAAKGEVNQVTLLSSFTEAREIFGESDPWKDGNQNELTLIRALELIYNNGGQNVYAVRTAIADQVSKAFYELKDGSIVLLRLEAKGTPGSWRDALKILVTSDPEAATKKQIELSFGNTQETYTVEAGKLAELEKAINDRSTLVTASNRKAQSGDRLPANTLDKGDPFVPGTNGAAAGKAEYEQSLSLLENEAVNVVVLAGQSAGGRESWAETVLEGHLKTTAQIKRERIGIIGSRFDAAGGDRLDVIQDFTLNNDRLIYTAPGVEVPNRAGKTDRLPGAYLAAAIAGLIASLPVQSSPTNKVLTLKGLATTFNAAQLEKLVEARVLAVAKQDGFRVVKGITTHDGAWRQITTRRIVDYATYGTRFACNPYIGKLNNERVRGAMKATLDAFLTRMVNDEALVGYTLEVSATRDQEKAGEAIVTMTLQPTFSIDFIKVTMYLG
jgi:Phage tail sheath C-terminal domain/Phage tail sheath protein subtilisin-like domain